MDAFKGQKILIGLIATVVLAAAVSLAQVILAPVVFAIFVIAVVWPVQRRLEQRIGTGLASLLTLLLTLAVIGSIVSMVVWGFSHVAQWTFANAGRFQAIYAQAGDWLEGHGFLLAGSVADHFNVRWLLRALQEISARANSLASFLVVTAVFVVFGLLEADIFVRQVARLPRYGAFLMASGADIASKMQTYMWVRTLMSIATGILVWGFTLASGMELATAWGVIALALNYIPVIGPFTATLLPTVFALVQFESWRMALFVFVVLNVVQFVSGSYLEPRIAGRTLAISPFLVLFAVFFWSFLWGLAGAFIGVPLVIAALTFCAHGTGTRWIADLFSGRAPEAG
ncbi:AI-2E family transporter [Azorhizobium caulinodans]|nr:AI-2E family transporter [Azorhizobium caulinodans]